MAQIDADIGSHKITAVIILDKLGLEVVDRVVALAGATEVVVAKDLLAAFLPFLHVPW